MHSHSTDPGRTGNVHLSIGLAWVHQVYLGVLSNYGPRFRPISRRHYSSAAVTRGRILISPTCISTLILRGWHAFLLFTTSRFVVDCNLEHVGLVCGFMEHHRAIEAADAGLDIHLGAFLARSDITPSSRE